MLGAPALLAAGCPQTRKQITDAPSERQRRGDLGICSARRAMISHCCNVLFKLQIASILQRVRLSALAILHTFKCSMHACTEEKLDMYTCRSAELLHTIFCVQAARALFLPRQDLQAFVQAQTEKWSARHPHIVPQLACHPHATDTAHLDLLASRSSKLQNGA